ncbi:MAG TPA: S41 family peptidase [Longimicrobiaceae bacterium]|nr:S41 family peptidase [Longimicrobiaceae bacterium]
MVAPALALGLTLAAAVPARSQSGVAAPPAIEPALARATFDSAWAMIDRTHFDSTFNGVDWRAVRKELRPRAAAARDVHTLRAVLTEMIGRLRQSHFYLIPAEVDETLAAVDDAADEEESPSASAGGDAEATRADSAGEPAEGEAGMEVRVVDGRFVVARMLRGGAAEAAGVRTGWTVEAVGRSETAPVLAALRSLQGKADPRSLESRALQALLPALSGPAGSAVKVSFLDGSGRRVARRLLLRPSPGARTRYGNLPELPVTLERERLRLEDGTVVGVIRFDLWMPVIARAFDEAVDELRDADGIILDLRGNPGGVGGMAMGIAGHFIDERASLGTMRTRDTELRFVVNPRRVDTRGQPVKPYAGPVAILLDPLSASTSEIFAGGMQKLGRARVFGETSAGAALPALSGRLPNGDVLMHAFASFTAPDGEPLEGKGVVPDEAAPPTRAALLAGRDPALAAATRWISQQKQGRAPAR